MKTSAPPFARYLFVCENERAEDRSCGPSGGTRIRETLKAAVKARGLASKIRVSRAGCLDACATGPNVLLSPDQIWFSEVTEQDVPAILARAAEGLS